MKKQALKAAIPGAIAGFLLSVALNYFFLPFPESDLANALGNGMSGLISGFMGGFMGIIMQGEKKRI